MRITGGKARGIPLLVPRSSRVRPTSDRVRSALFQLLSAPVLNARVLDLYAGTGALGIEALSRGAGFADFVETDARLCRMLAQNLETAGFAEVGHVHHARVERALRFLEGPYQLVLLDPPYALPGVQRVMDRLASSDLIDKNGVVVLEHSSHGESADGFGTVHRIDTRRYGDTTLSIYRASES